MKFDKNTIFTTITIIMAVIVVLFAGYIVINHLGLVDGYDFGGGAYYYVDIPSFEKHLPDKAYTTTVPLYVHIVLFFAWGWLMWRAWNWIDNKTN